MHYNHFIIQNKWIIFIFIWRIFMSDIVICNNVMPVVSMCDMCAASEPFYHPDRVADFYVLIYVTEGVIYVTEEDTDYSVLAGEMLFLKRELHHWGKRLVPRGTKWCYVHFTTDEPRDIGEFSPDVGPLPPYLPSEYRSVISGYQKNMQGSKAERRLTEMIKYALSDDSMKKWRINGMFNDVLTEIVIGDKERNDSESLSGRIRKNVASHYKEPFSSKVLENELFLNYRYMAYVFKRDMGITIQQYHISLKMNEAARLLRSTLSPVGEIADTVGYSDMLYFSRCFHNFFGVSPTQYRKNLRIL